MRTSTSKYRGVAWHKGDKSWRAKIVTGDRHVFLGNFKEEEEAARCYDAAARVVRGARARCNFPVENSASLDRMRRLLVHKAAPVPFRHVYSFQDEPIWAEPRPWLVLGQEIVAAADEPLRRIFRLVHGGRDQSIVEMGDGRTATWIPAVDSHGRTARDRWKECRLFRTLDQDGRLFVYDVDKKRLFNHRPVRCDVTANAAAIELLAQMGVQEIAIAGSDIARVLLAHALQPIYGVTIRAYP